MSARAIWKGVLKVEALSCPVALYSAISSTEHVSFHIVNRRTGNRVSRRYIDSETEKFVEQDDIMKGYDSDRGTILLDPEEIKAAVPESDKTLEIDAFLPCGEIDTAFLERPYFLLPTDSRARETYDLIRRAMQDKGVAALVQTVLFRRIRTLLIRCDGDGLIATTLNFDYEVRAADAVFKPIPEIRIEKEMLELAEHIIATKRAEFDPSAFTDRYEEALAELVKAKIAGRKPKKLKPAPRATGSSLLSALRQSAGLDKADKETKTAAKSTKAKTATRDRRAANGSPAPRRKAS